MDHHIKTDTQGNQTKKQNLKLPEAIPFLADQSLAKFSASLEWNCFDLLNASNH